MANVFFRQNHMDVADSLYTRVTAIWHSHLLRIVTARTRKNDTQSGMSSAVVELEERVVESLGKTKFFGVFFTQWKRFLMLGSSRLLGVFPLFQSLDVGFRLEL